MITTFVVREILQSTKPAKRTHKVNSTQPYTFRVFRRSAAVNFNFFSSLFLLDILSLFQILFGLCAIHPRRRDTTQNRQRSPKWNFNSQFSWFFHGLFRFSIHSFFPCTFALAIRENFTRSIKVLKSTLPHSIFSTRVWICSQNFTGTTVLLHRRIINKSHFHFHFPMRCLRKLFTLVLHDFKNSSPKKSCCACV